MWTGAHAWLSLAAVAPTAVASRRRNPSALRSHPFLVVRAVRLSEGAALPTPLFSRHAPPSRCRYSVPWLHLHAIYPRSRLRRRSAREARDGSRSHARFTFGCLLGCLPAASRLLDGQGCTSAALRLHLGCTVCSAATCSAANMTAVAPLCCAAGTSTRPSPSSRRSGSWNAARAVRYAGERDVD